MKTKRCFWTLCTVACLSISTLVAQNKKEEKRLEKKVAVKELIKSANYKIDVSIAYPLQGKPVNLTSSYYLEIKNDSIISQLPFYGRAFSIPYGGGKGLNFKSPIEHYEIVCDKKKETMKISIKTRTDEDRYHYTINLFSNGTARINVTMQQREAINYSGELELPPF